MLMFCFILANDGGGALRGLFFIKMGQGYFTFLNTWSSEDDIWWYSQLSKH